MKNKKIKKLEQGLNALFPERKEAIHGALCAILAGEHVLLIGPPGTAKSALVRSIAQAFGGRYFEWLLTKFSTPEEIFGPISLSALEQDRMMRVVAGKLPEAEFAFVDEIFKASSAILNTMLTLVNERIFHNGKAISCPLVSMFGASNELPEGKELEALFDRFILRYDLAYVVQPGSFRKVILAPEPSACASLTMSDLVEATKASGQVVISDATVEALMDIRDACRAEGIVASDRRWKKMLKLIQANAWMDGQAETCPEDLTLLIDGLWREPAERPKVARIVGQLADPLGSQAIEILDAARETQEKVVSLKTTDRKSYIAQAANALEQFRQQQERLEKLTRRAGRRAKSVIADSNAEIEMMHDDLAKAVSAGLGLRRMA